MRICPGGLNITELGMPTAQRVPILKPWSAITSGGHSPGQGQQRGQGQDPKEGDQGHVPEKGRDPGHRREHREMMVIFDPGLTAGLDPDPDPESQRSWRSL